MTTSIKLAHKINEYLLIAFILSLSIPIQGATLAPNFEVITDGYWTIDMPSVVASAWIKEYNTPTRNPKAVGVNCFWSTAFASLTVVHCDQVTFANGTTGTMNSNYNKWWNFRCPGGVKNEDWQIYGSGSEDYKVYEPHPYCLNLGTIAEYNYGPCDTGECSIPSPLKGNPINVSSGNKFLIETDYTSPVPGGLQLRRYYNSKFIGFLSPLGTGWTMDYRQRLRLTPSGTLIVAQRQDGRAINFRKINNVWVTQANIREKLVTVTNGWNLITANDSIEYYEAVGSAGVLKSITTREGFVTIVENNLANVPGYPGLGDANSATVDRVTDPFGRQLKIYYVSGKMTMVVDPDGNEILYTHATGLHIRLSNVKYPDDTPLTTADNPVRTYHYEETGFPVYVTGITDENSNRFSTYGYDDTTGNATFSEHAGGAARIDVVYNVNGTRTITGSLGNVCTYAFETIYGKTNVSDVTGDLCGSPSESVEYDANGYPESRTDFNGNLTNYVYNSRGLQTSRTEAYGTADQRTIATTWHSTLRVPTGITEPGKTTTFTYDSVGQLLTGTETDTATSAARTTTYTYHNGGGTSPEGLLSTINGPRTDVSDVTSYEYDTDGNLISVINALSQETEVTSHDTHGRPLSMTDPNGTVTALTYDNRGRLLTRTVDSKTTTFEYDGVGNITKTTLPNGTFLINEYDDAQRLTAVEDNLGNRIEYTLDDQGNRIVENVKDTGSTLTRTLARTYNDLNQLIMLTGGEGQAVAYGYDDNGNQTNITVDPTGLSQATVQAFDALNRRITVQDAEYGVTAYDYDARDNLIGVTDPRTLVTAYQYDGLDDLVEQTSPDTGVTTYDYDTAGNRIAQTDARNVTVEYDYDVLNRLALITYPDTGQNVTYVYDTCTNGIGHLCEMTDESGTTEYTYDARGNRASETSTRGTVVKTIGYTYDDANQVETITYPNGRVVEYSRDTNGRIEQVDTVYNTQTYLLADAITYVPFGPVDAMTYGNSLEHTRGYDLDYRVTQLLTGDVSTLQAVTYTYDDANNIIGITNVLDGSRTQAFGYDELNRLTGADGIYGDYAYTYDANGNRQTQTLGMATDTYSYISYTHRLDEVDDGITPQTFSYDNNGNTSSNGTHEFVYGDNNRLATVEVSSTPVAAYFYNGKGERVIKDVIDPTLYYYDQDGLLLAELDENGSTLREYAYLDGQPLAVMGGAVIYTYHTDHLGTPQLLTNGTQQVVWSADYEPFGKADITTGTVTNNLRFPGQYFDEETGLHYNYFRDYDPTTGRYIQPDPIGTMGGLNLYGYVGQNPLSWTDSLGLDVTIDITRTGRTANSITGTITATSNVISTTYSGDVLENRNPPNPNLPTPTGSYQAFVDKRANRKDRIELIGVPHATDIQIHLANQPSELEGCFAPGTATKIPDWISNSGNAMDSILNIIRRDNTGKITVNINNNFPSP